MSYSVENIESAFATSFAAHTTVPRWQRKAMEALPSATPKSSPQFDRFIPNRSSTSIEEGHFHLTNTGAAQGEECCSPSKLDYQRAMASNLFPDTGNRVLAFSQQAPKAREGFQGDLRVLYSQTQAAPAKKASSRYIPQNADRILDAPDMKTDFYLNVLDWSASNVIAVALGSVSWMLC